MLRYAVCTRNGSEYRQGSLVYFRGIPYVIVKILEGGRHVDLEALTGSFASYGIPVTAIRSPKEYARDWAHA